MTFIVYTSGTGSTKRYAEMLGEKTGYEVVSLEKAQVGQDDEMIYCGWIMLGELQGYEKAKQLGKIKLVAAVGMMNSEKEITKLKEKNSIEEPLFFLMGALDKKTFVKKLEESLEEKAKSELNNPMLSMMLKPMVSMAIKKLLSDLKNGDESDRKVMQLIEEGFDCVSEDNLGEILGFLE